MSDYPKITANILSGYTRQESDQRSILLVGGKTSGSATSGALESNILTKKDFNDKFGQDSQIAKAGRAIVDLFGNSIIRPTISAISLDDEGGATAATGSVVFSGTATTAGKITVYIDSKINGKYEISVAVGDTATIIGDALKAAIEDNASAPVSAINTTGSVALTAINKGSQGNTIGIASEIEDASGVSVALTAMSGGATDPTLTGIFDVVGDQRFTSIIFPAEWGLTELTDFTESRFNVDNDVLDGQAIVAAPGTFATLQSAGNSYNLKTLTYIGLRDISSDNFKASNIFESPLVIAAQFAAIRELRLTVGANISRFSVGGNSGIGGSFYAATPYHNTPLFNLPVINIGNDFDKLEKGLLENAGISLLANSSSNQNIICGEILTTYKTDTSGNVDKTFKFLNYIDSYSIVRSFIFNNMKSDFAQKILTSGDLIAGLPQVNKSSFLATMVSYYYDLSGANYGILKAGSNFVNEFKQALEDTVVLNLSEGKITGDMIANINTQLRDIIINIIPTFE